MLRKMMLLTVVGIGLVVFADQAAMTISGKDRALPIDAVIGTRLDADLSALPHYRYIPNVPDWNQPTRSGMFNTCAPVSAMNILEYYALVAFPGIPGLIDLTDTTFYRICRCSSQTAEEIAYFMGTNGLGSPSRINQSLPGTFYVDQDTGLAEYIAWDTAKQFDPATPMPPSWKMGYVPKVTLFDPVADTTITADTLWKYFVAEIDSGRPVKIDFNFWNPVFTGYYTMMPFYVGYDTLFYYVWGTSITSSPPGAPPEDWTDEIGHAVTGIGYVMGKPPIGIDNYKWAIVHDNWPTPITPENVVIPWDHLKAMVAVDRPVATLVPSIDNEIPVPPHADDGVISSHLGLDPPGLMGIWAPSHNASLYFPSDSLPEPGYPQAWMISGLHMATLFGPATVNIPDNPIVTVPDRYGRPCTLYVQIPAEDLIDEASDLNAIGLSSGEAVVIPVDDTVETMVFMASCDGSADVSADQSMAVILEYDDLSVDSVIFDDIHPAGRGDITSPEEIFVYDNEIFHCNPAYFDSPSAYYDLYHSETWHWYALYPDNDKRLDNMSFEGRQGKDNSDIYILAISYGKREAVQEKGLVGHWRFEEGHGDIACDETEYHHDGTVRGASWIEVEGCFSDSALEFHGGGQFFDGDRVAVPHSSGLDISGEFTIAARIRTSGTDDYLAVVDKYIGGSGIDSKGISLFLGAGKLRCIVYSGSDGAGDCIGSTDLRDGLFHHVAGVWDGSHIRVYVDSQPENDVSWNRPPSPTTNDLGIGERMCGWGGYMPFLGIIDEVYLYNKALTATEIGELYCDCIPGDANNDCVHNVADAVYLINFIFKGGPPPAPYQICSGDANCDCQVNVADAVYVINYIFKGGRPPCECIDWLLYCGQPLRM